MQLAAHCLTTIKARFIASTVMCDAATKGEMDPKSVTTAATQLHSPWWNKRYANMVLPKQSCNIAQQ